MRNLWTAQIAHWQLENIKHPEICFQVYLNCNHFGKFKRKLDIFNPLYSIVILKHFNLISRTTNGLGKEMDKIDNHNWSHLIIMVHNPLYNKITKFTNNTSFLLFHFPIFILNSDILQPWSSACLYKGGLENVRQWEVIWHRGHVFDGISANNDEMLFWKCVIGPSPASLGCLSFYMSSSSHMSSWHEGIPHEEPT